MTTRGKQRPEDDARELECRLALVWRVFELRRENRLPPIWIDQWQVSVRREPWGCQEEISWDQLISMVATAEQTKRKPPAAESSQPAQVAQRA